MTRMAAMSAQEIRESLKALPEWRLEDNTLVRSVPFPKFLWGIEFVNAVAHLAERHNHHPDIDIRYRQVTLRYVTHEAHGITQRDIEGAKEVNALLVQFKKLGTGSIEAASAPVGT